jgi:Mn-dependent DtxR family transcriptional regulator
VGDIKKYLKFPHSTLNSLIKRLSKKEMLRWEAHQFVELQSEGRVVAEHLMQHHVILDHFFISALKIDPRDAHEEALRVASLISCKVIDTMQKQLVDCQLKPCKIYVDNDVMDKYH